MPATPSIEEKFDKSVSLLSWAYNEEESIVEFIDRAVDLMNRTVKDYEIVLIDDASTDRTFELATELQSKYPKLRVLQNPVNLDVGGASKRAISEAKKEYLFWQTVDWCYDISDLRQHLEKLRTFDIVQGVRSRPVPVRMRFLKPVMKVLQLFGIQHLTRRSDTFQKALVSVVNYMTIRLLFAVPLSDFQNVTIYPRSWIQNLELEANSAFANPEGLIKSYWSGKSICEVPINFIPRSKGVPKGTRFSTIRDAAYDVLRLWIKWVVCAQFPRERQGTVCRVAE